MNQKNFLNSLLEFLTTSPTPFHAVANMAQHLEDAGFEKLDEGAQWQVKAGGSYYVTRNDSSIVAFRRSRKDIARSGIRMVGAHTDSPCLRLKPNAEVTGHGYLRAAVEVYGGVLQNPWFDRDLSMAGRLSFRQKDGSIGSRLIDFQRAVAIIPSLAIHLDRNANKDRSINAQLHLPPLLAKDKTTKSGAKSKSTEVDLRSVLLGELKRTGAAKNIKEILEYEISFYDTQPAQLVGLEQEFIASARLDNLLSCWIATTAIAASDSKQDILMVANDHEEVGSASASGAHGPFLRSVLQRLCDDVEHNTRCINQSVMISADNAHAIHPNYPDRHEPGHAPRLNEGPVLKVNNNQRYASNSETSALFRSLCQDAKVPMQTMVARSDMGCGTTIGPITASEIGVPTVDVGVPQLAMHSIRETAGSADAWSLNRVLMQFFKRDRLLN